MTFPSIRSVAADSNVLLAAIAGRAASRVFAVPELVVVTTEANREEVAEYLPVFADRYGIAVDVVAATFALLPVDVYGSAAYADHVPAAKALLAGRDEDDVPLAALALSLEIPIWSNDRDFDGFPHGVYTTARLLKALFP